MIGKTLAHYEITGLLGQGGMGEVYRARDTRLDREVAVKVLPREMSGDPERIARFEREARTLATLQHPNVASIYGFESSDEARFLVMELIEGEDMSERLKRGPLGIDDAVDVARQIAAGLEAAHEQGIVHRDLKPANIKLAPDGQVKILDFGLARAYLGDTSSVADPLNSPTITAAMTQVGVVLGTAAYMSPEQARGRPVDRRADIWAFGVVVFEMITGVRLFGGETISDTLAGVLKTEIEMSNLPRACPAALRRLLARCLDRNPATRLRDIGEARILLEQPLDNTEEEAGTTARGRRGPVLLASALAGLALGALAMWILVPQPPAPEPPREVHLAIPVETDGTPRSALAADGSALLYRETDRLWIREFAAMEPRPVPGTAGALMGTWSPDGQWIAFSTATNIFKCRPDGGGRVRLCEIETDMHPWAGSLDWTEDDRIVFATGDTGLWVISPAGGDPRVLLPPGEGETDFHDVAALPGGRGFLFHPHVDLRFDSIDLFTGTERREVLRMEGQQLNSAAYVAGHLVFMRRPDNVGIWAVPFSLETLAVTGEPFLLVPDAAFPAVSRRGDLAFVPESQVQRQIVRLDAAGKVVATLGEPVLGTLAMATSPDGRKAAVVIENENFEIWIVDLASGERQRLTFSKSPIETVSWSADGKRVIHSAGMTGKEMHQEIRALDGSGVTAVDVRGKSAGLTTDGGTMVLAVWNEANESSIGYVSLADPDLRVTMIADTGLAEDNPVLSPDNRFVAYETVETGRREIVIRTFPDGTGHWQVSLDGGSGPFWSPDGKRLYFSSLSNGWLNVVDVSRDPDHISAPRRHFGTDMMQDLSALPDGGFATLVASAGQARARYEVWLNWGAWNR